MTQQPRPRAIPIAIELGDDLAWLAEAPAAGSFKRDLAGDVAVLAGRLGISGEPIVKLQPGPTSRPVRQWVHGKAQPYSPALLQRAWLATAPRELQDLPAREPQNAEHRFPAAWLREYARESADPALLLACIRRLVGAILIDRPSSLVGPLQLAAYAQETSLRGQNVAAILKPLLDLGVSTANRTVIARIVREGKQIRRPLEDTVEAVFTELRGHEVELLVHPASLTTLLGLERPPDRPFSVYAAESSETFREIFRDLERTFFGQFGFLLPRLVWVPSGELPEGTITVKIDEWRGLPLPLIFQPERVVLGTGDDATIRVSGRPVLHPVTGVRCTVTDEGKDALDSAGLATWGPIDFVVHNVYAELRRRAGRLLGLEDVEYQLARLRYQLLTFGGGEPGEFPSEFVLDGPFPELVHAALARYSLGDLTRILRGLVEEGLSIQNVPRILDRLLHYDTVPVGLNGLVLFDDRLPSVAGAAPRRREGWRSPYEFLRKQLASYLSNRYAWYENTLVAYILDPTIEDAAPALVADERGRLPRSTDAVEALRDAVWAELQYLAPTPAGQVILTTPDARPAIRELIAPELPELPVLSYSELRPDLNVQPLARITVD
jgi:type III secretion protein V